MTPPTPAASPAPAPAQVASSAWAIFRSVWDYAIFEVDKQPVTLHKLMLAVLCFVVGYFLARRLSRAIHRYLLPHLEAGPATAVLIRTVSFYTLLLFFTLFALVLANVPIAIFTLVGGALAIGVGFGSQNIVSNFASGIILIIERTMKPGDIIEVEGRVGTVERIGGRSTIVRTGANAQLVVPNSLLLEKPVLNHTLSDDLLRCEIAASVVYGSNIDVVTRCLLQAASEQAAVEKEPAASVFLSRFGEGSIDFDLAFWLHLRGAGERRRIESELRLRTLALFTEAGIVLAPPRLVPTLRREA